MRLNELLSWLARQEEEYLLVEHGERVFVVPLSHFYVTGDSSKVRWFPDGRGCLKLDDQAGIDAEVEKILRDYEDA